MISWISSQLLPMSILISVLIILRPVLIRLVGASTVYRLWGLVPLLLMMSLFSNALYSPELSTEITKLVVTFQGDVRAISNTNWMISIWLTGIVALGALILYSSVRSRSESTLLKVDTRRLGVKLPASVQARMSDDVSSPLLSGIVRPTLLLPTDFFAEYSTEEQALIIQHELRHFRRGDISWNILAIAIVLCFWFNPLMWIGYFQFRKDQELSCDEETLYHCKKKTKLVYVQALVKCASKPHPFSLVQLQYGDKNMIKNRILNIRSNRKTSLSKKLITLMLGVVGCVSLTHASNIDKVGASEAAPKPIMRVEPRYPAQAAKDKVSGFVVLKFDIDSAGSVYDVEVVKSVPDTIFSKESVHAVSQWKYQTSAYGQQDVLVQLDFLLDKEAPQIERIRVTN